MRMRFFSLIPVLLLLAACGAAKTATAPPAPNVTVAHPLARQIVDWDDFVGQFVAIDSVDVRPRVSGYLQSVAFKDGQVVKKGQLLFVIDGRPYQAALDQARGGAAHAQAAAANAHAELARGKTLLAAHAMSQQAYDVLVASQLQTTADLESAQAGVRTAALNVGFTRVTAPVSGRISDRRVSPGNLVTADQTVLTNIASLDPIRFAFTGSEALYLKYERANARGTRTSSRDAQNPVEIRLQDEPTYRWKGRMDFVDNSLDTGSGTIRGRAVVANPQMFLTPGMFGHMRLLGSGAYPALLVPDRAVVTDQTRQVVYVVGPGGKIVEREVEPGPIAQGLRVIRKGISASDLVVIDGVQRLKVGQPAKTTLAQIQPEAAAVQRPEDDGVDTVPSAAATIVADGAR
ncbi:MAG: efflux RND transporter periplasmic adaptor subunit [Phenylobacterium sp.]|nr:MAG: efflux RND transporter periplasmic adaptor subunit [Phenylobacterium sp.]